MSNKKKKRTQEKPAEKFHLADLSFLWQIAVIVVVAILLSQVIGAIYPVTNNAMKIMVKDAVTMEESNVGLQKGDYVMVSRVNYWFLNPQRGDVVMYSVDDGATFLFGRVIGLPGESISIDDSGFISINGKQYNTPNKELFSQYMTIHLEGQTYPIVLGDDEFFILCDNPGLNTDSRSPSVAGVSKDEIIGKVLIKLWPFKRLAPVL